MTPEQRNKEINKLTRRKLAGQAAREHLGAFTLLKEEYQTTYVKQLIAHSRADGQVKESEVWKLVALDDIEGDLKHRVAQGDKATRELNELSIEAGGGDYER